MTRFYQRQTSKEGKCEPLDKESPKSQKTPEFRKSKGSMISIKEERRKQLSCKHPIRNPLQEASQYSSVKENHDK